MLEIMFWNLILFTIDLGALIPGTFEQGTM